jgi:MFS family permease
MLGAGMLGPLFAVFVERIGGNILDISWAYATYLIVTGIGMIIVGKIGDRVGYSRLMLLGYGLSAIGTFGYLLVTSSFALFVVQIVLGVALALSNPTWYALYDKFSGDGGSDGYVWGLSTGMGYTVSGIAMMIGGLIVHLFSFNVLFVIMGSVLTISTIYQASILKFERR